MNLWIRVTVQSGNFPEIPVFECDAVRPEMMDSTLAIAEQTARATLLAICAGQAYIREYVGPTLIATIRCKARVQQQHCRHVADRAPKQEMRNPHHRSHDNIRDEAQKLRASVLEFLQKHPMLKVGDFVRWMEEEKGESIDKQRVYSALYTLAERKQIKRKEAGVYQLARNATTSQGYAA
jgi:hypothetical protein